MIIGRLSVAARGLGRPGRRGQLGGRPDALNNKLRLIHLTCSIHLIHTIRLT